MNIIKVRKTIKDIHKPCVIFLVGPPMSGKDTFINNNEDILSDFVVISRDQIVLDVYGSDDYDLAFKSVNQKEVDRILKFTIETSIKDKRNVIINMTNLTRKRRIGTLDMFTDDYSSIAILFPILDDEEYQRRNRKRQLEENKTIPEGVLRNMIKSYQTIEKDEGFDKIISL